MNVKADPTEAAIESELQAKGLNAPRLSPALIDERIADVVYATGYEMWNRVRRPDDPVEVTPINTSSVPALQCLTVCVLVLKNGYTIVGKSACASPENFDVEMGRKIAFEDARRQIWALEGYALKSRLVAENANRDRGDEATGD